MTFDTSKAYEYTRMGGTQVLTSSNPTPDERGGFITLGRGGVKGWDEPVSMTADGTPNGRTLFLSGAVKAPEGRLQRDELYDNLVGAIPMGDPEPVVFYRDGLVRHVLAKLGSSAPQKEIISPRKANYGIQLYAKDSRRLSGDGSGYEYSSATERGLAGSMTMYNSGNGITPPMELRFEDCTNPRITVDGSPTAPLWIDLTVPAGLELRVDLETHQAFLSNGLDVTGALRGDWQRLDRKTNTFRFSADALGAESLAAIWWLDSWL